MLNKDMSNQAIIALNEHRVESDGYPLMAGVLIPVLTSNLAVMIKPL